MPIFSRTGGTMPSLSSRSAASRWTGNSSGLPCSEASSFARWTASCALTVNLSQRIGMVIPTFSLSDKDKNGFQGLQSFYCMSLRDLGIYDAYCIADRFLSLVASELLQLFILRLAAGAQFLLKLLPEAENLVCKVNGHLV